jgi:hypothetical protein
MVGAKWTATVAAALAWASFALGQSAGTPAPAAEYPRIVTVQELGKPAQRCRVLRTWRESDGMIAFEVQVITTGERMTLVESSAISTRAGSVPGSQMHAMASRIYHWSPGSAPPAGAPLAPADAVVVRPPATPAAGSDANAGYNQYQSWPSPTSPYTVVVPPASQATAGRTFSPYTSQNLRDPVTGRDVTVNGQTVSRQAGGKDKVVTERAEPSDWHRSWGRADDHRARVPKVDLPHADASQPDPLKDPENFSRRPLDNFDLPPKKDGKKPDQGSMAPQGLAKNGVQPAALQADGKPAPAAGNPPNGQGVAPCPANCCNGVVMCQDRLTVIKESPTLVAVFQRLWGCQPCANACDPCQPAAAPVVVRPQPRPKEVCIVTSQPVLVKPQPVVVSEKVVRTPKPKPPAKAKESKPRVVKATSKKPAVAKAAPPKPKAVQPAPPLVPPPPQDHTPPGLRSVMSASTDAGQIVYVPVPIITVPPLRNPAALMAPAQAQQVPPPPPQRPQPPEGMNAFTTPEAPPPAGQPTPPEMANAFTVPAEEGQPNMAYGLNPGMYAVSMSGRPFPGYSQGINPYVYVAQPYMAAPPTRFPWSYPQTASVPMMPAVAQAIYRGSNRGGTTKPAVAVPQMIAALKDSLYPSHREWAAGILAGLDWHQHPEALAALLRAAHDDPAATVRAACARGLGKMNADTQAVRDTLQALKADASPLVVQDAEQALTRLNGIAAKAK